MGRDPMNIEPRILNKKHHHLILLLFLTHPFMHDASFIFPSRLSLARSREENRKSSFCCEEKKKCFAPAELISAHVVLLFCISGSVDFLVCAVQYALCLFMHRIENCIRFIFFPFNLQIGPSILCFQFSKKINYFS